MPGNSAYVENAEFGNGSMVKGFEQDFAGLYYQKAPGYLYNIHYSYPFFCFCFQRLIKPEQTFFSFSFCSQTRLKYVRSSTNKQTMSNNTVTSGTTSFLWDFHFNLNYECSFEDIHGPHDITLKSRVHDDGKTKIVSGFTVRVNSPTEEHAKDIAEKQAKILVDILAVLSTTPLEYTLTGFEMYHPEGENAIVSSLTSSYLKFGIGRPTDLNKGNSRKLIQTRQAKGNDQDLAHAISSANAGLKAEGYKLYEVMVRDYYLVIEKAVNSGKLNQGVKYKHLRDALSHSGMLRKDTKDGLTDTNNFPQDYFDFTPYGEFDHTSNKNRQHVKDEAINLKQIALNYLKAEL